MRLCFGTAILASALAIGSACAQDTGKPLPLHPIDTKPESQGPGCSYSATASKGSGKVSTSGANTCAPSANDPLPLPSQPDYAAMAQQAAGQAQQNSAPPQAQKPQAAAPASNPSQFAFPGETAVPKVNDDGTLSPPEPATPQPATPQPSASGLPGLHDTGSSGTSSSSSSSSSSDDDTLPAPDTTTPGDAAPAPKRGRKKLPPVARQSPDERETEDVQVGKFYMNDSNWLAAYDRAKDAISISDDDWEAHLMLADSARKLGRLDEAQKQYKRSLELDPTPKGKKAAEAALKEMGGTGGDTLLP